MERATNFGDRHLALLVTGFTTLLFVGKILYAANFDVTTSLAIVGATSSATLLLALAVALTPSALTALLGATVSILGTLYALRQPIFGTVVAVITTGFFVALTAPVGTLLLLVIVLPLILIPQISSTRITQRNPAALQLGPLVAMRSAILIMLPVLVITAFISPHPWPRERLDLTTGKEIIGFVLNSESQWWPVLTGGGRGVVYIRAELVGSRLICTPVAPGTNWWDARVTDMRSRTSLPVC